MLGSQVAARAELQELAARPAELQEYAAQIQKFNGFIVN